MPKNEITLSALPKSWILDLDGTLVKHNGYLLDGQDSLLDGATKILGMIHPEDKVIILTSRNERYKVETETFLHNAGIRYDTIIWNAPYGERILVNDRKPSGLITAIAINVDRDSPPAINFRIDKNL